MARTAKLRLLPMAPQKLGHVKLSSVMLARQTPKTMGKSMRLTGRGERVPRRARRRVEKIGSADFIMWVKDTEPAERERTRACLSGGVRGGGI